MLKVSLALRFPVVMKDLRFFVFYYKVICIELKNQAMEKLENKSKILSPSPSQPYYAGVTSQVSQGLGGFCTHTHPVTAGPVLETSGL